MFFFSITIVGVSYGRGINAISMLGGFRSREWKSLRGLSKRWLLFFISFGSDSWILRVFRKKRLSIGDFREKCDFECDLCDLIK